MGKRQRKQPLTTQSKPNGAKFKHSRVETARLIRRFHVLNKELAKLKGDPNSSLRQQKEKSILSEMESMGGLDWYQKASQLGQSKTRGGDSSKWLIQTLKAHCQDALDAAAKPLKILDIGAVAPDNYKAYASWIHAKPIDLNPQHPDIQQQDFLKMKVPDEKFDIVCLSLVINFVGDPKDRGQMLIHTRDFLSATNLTDRLHYLFLVVPLPCVTNSRYMTHEHLVGMMKSIGYSHLIHHHFSNKLAYYLFKLNGKPPLKNVLWKKKMIAGKEGGGHNNFSVVIE